MSFELSKLQFSVDTDQLQAAVQMVDKLATSVNKLKAPLKGMGDVAGDAGKSVDKGATVITQATAKQVKSTETMATAIKAFYKEQERLARAEQKQKEQMFRAGDSMNQEAVKAYHKFLDAQTTAQKKAVDTRLREMERETKGMETAAKKQQSILERQQSEARLMAKGASRGEASVLARAEARGEGADIPEIIKAQQTKRSFSGGDSLDKSISGLRNMNQELGQSREGYRQMIAYQKEYLKLQLEGNGKEASLIALNKKETDTLYRDKLRLLELYKQTKNASLDFNDPDFVTKVKAQKNALTDLKTAIREVETGFNKVAQIKRPLENIRTIDSTKRRNELQYMARATSVQLGDIGVSLAGGQNPLTVMLQQGDQLRAILGGVGKDTKAMQEVMSGAFTQIITGFITVGQAMTSLVGGAFKATGDAIVNSSMKWLGFNFILDKVRLGFEKLDYNFGKNTVKSFDAIMQSAGGLGTALRTLAGIATGTAVVGLIGIAFAYKEIIQTSQDLSVALAMSGGAIAINKDEALKMSAALASTSGTSMQVAGVITEIAKAGNLSRDSIAGITKASLDLEKYGGIAVKDTVALYAKLADDPVKGLTELALKTGDVSQATLDHIEALVKQGNGAQAVTEAIAEMSRVNGLAAQKMKDDMSPLEVLWSNMKTQLTLLKEEFYSIASSKSAVDTLTNAWNNLSRSMTVVGIALRSVTMLRGALKSDESGVGTVGVASTNEKIKAEKEYINVLEAGVSRRRLVTKNEAEARAENIEGIKAIKEAKAVYEKYNKISNLSPEGREKAKAEAIAKANKLALESQRAFGADTADIEKRRLTTIENINEEFKAKKEPKEKKAQKTEAEKQMEAAKKFFEDYLDVDSGKLPTYTEDIKKLELAIASLSYTDEQATKVRAAYAAKQPEAIEAARKQEEVTKQNKKAFEDLVKEINSADKALQKLKKSYAIKAEDALFDNATQSKELEFRESLIGMTQEQKEVMRIAFEEESRLRKINYQEIKDLQKAQEEFNEAVKKAPSKQAEANRLKGEAEASIKLAAEGQREIASSAKSIGMKELENAKLDKFSEGIADALVTGMTQGAKAGKKKLRDLIVAELTKTITLNIQANVQALLSGMMGGKQGGGIMDMLTGGGNLSSLAGGVMQMMTGGSVGASAMSLTGANAVGALGGDSLGALIGMNGGWAGVPAIAPAVEGLTALAPALTAVGSAAPIAAAGTGGMGAAIMGALGPVGLFAGAALALFAIFGDNEEKVPTVLNDLSLFNNSLVGLPFLELALGSDEAAQGLRDVLYGLENASPTMRKLAGETLSLSVELMRASGDIAGARNLARNLGTRGMSEEEIAVFDYNESLRDQIEAHRAGAAAASAGASAAQAAAQAEEQLAQTRYNIAGKLNVLLGRTTQKEFDRATALAATTDEASIAMLKLTYQLEDMYAAVDANYARLERSIAAERKIAELRLQTATELAAALKSTLETVIQPMARNAAQAQLRMYTAVAQAGGSLPTAEALKPALETLAKPSIDLFGSFSEYMIDQARTANDISDLTGYADKQVDAEQLSLERLDAQLALAKSQLDALKGVDNSVVSVADAVLGFEASMLALANAQSSAPSYNYNPITASGGGSSGGGGGSYSGGATAPTFENIAGQDNKDIVAAYREYYNRNPDDAGYQAFLSSQLTGDTLMRAILGASAPNKDSVDYQTAVQRGYNPDDPLSKYLKSILYPNSSSGAGGAIEGAFAVGSNYIPRDMNARIHKGEEITPRPYVDLQRAAREEANELMARLLASNEELKEEVINLRKTADEGNKNTRKTADTLQGQQGVPFLVEIAQ